MNKRLTRGLLLIKVIGAVLTQRQHYAMKRVCDKRRKVLVVGEYPGRKQLPVMDLELELISKDLISNRRFQVNTAKDLWIREHAPRVKSCEMFKFWCCRCADPLSPHDSGPQRPCYIV